MGVTARLWRVSAAGLMVLAVAGCSGGTSGASQPQASSSSPAAALHGFADGCPQLTAAPYGIPAQGKLSPGYTPPGEQAVLDQTVPGATIDLTTCQYSVGKGATPGLRVTLRVFRGDTGAAQSDKLFQTDRSAAKSLGGVNYADAPRLGDAAYAWYDEANLFVAARTANAYVVIRVSPSQEAKQKFDLQQPLQQQVPALTAVMNDVLAGLD